MIKMKQPAILPKTEEEREAIRVYPEKKIKPPNYRAQKTGIIFYSIVLLLLMTILIIGILMNEENWSIYLFMFIPLMQVNHFLNLFAIMDDGILSGKGFVSWNRIKDFYFVPIDINHRFYGYGVNNKYELKIRAGIHSISCIVTTEEVKERLNRILSEHGRIEELDESKG